MIRKISAIALSLMFVSFTAAADDVGGGTIQIQKDTATPVAEAPVTAAPPAFVELQSRTIAAGIGARIGEGSLLVDGQEHAFSLRGISLGDLGVSRMSALGPVENLTSIEDFAGTYVAVEAGAAMGKGIATLTMRNEHGVVITLESDVRGVQLTLAGQALSIELK
ncbi:MAG: hypothetical protein JRH16_03815 [Deltaproteobacteria bacterium]|nr:hypothetical protein [Deltaproteobacteria bacterium]MBW2361090.1 hypothetical protein [Deltaproteobacteria bacterium]